ncbi:MAG: hypothetical protein VKL60_16835 [Sphaerospermopsis sp.]|uniref:hypothetical protein n=1 Tax=Sphaerospermopsis sp. LEGE 00249 TaxID=1380707 RepID=UPI00164CF1AF|nr:hypothetical protein [Sphaerospermopsis sp. LEGE 00249]MBC5794545.1 hypothetical protein [Sphaerospermopsis sp. LEGE 00249]MEB3150665.1 hypothetical protein [Sphaerospermopsis sp.]
MKWRDTENAQGTLFIECTPNLSQKFLNAIKEKLGYNYPQLNLIEPQRTQSTQRKESFRGFLM